MRGIRIETIEAAAKDRPEGYLEDVMSYVVERKGNFVLFENDDYYMLRDKYSGDVDPMVRGPGTELHRLLGKFGLHMKKGCACKARMVQMNKWGCVVCDENIDTIVGWLAEEAAGRGLPFLSGVGRLLVKRAIHNARKKEKINVGR